MDIISRTTPEQVAKIELPYEREFADSITGDGSPVRKDISAITIDLDRWKCLITGETVFGSKIDTLFGVYDKAKQKRVLEDEAILIKSELSVKKIEDFESSFLKDYKANNILYSMFESIGAVVKDEQIKSDVPRVGYNTMDEKGAYIDGWYIHYSRSGTYGSGIGASENSNLFGKLCETENSVVVDGVSIVEQIETGISNLKQNGFVPRVIVVALNFNEHYALVSDQRFIARWRKDCPSDAPQHCEGILRTKQGDYPVYRLHRDKRANIVGVFDLQRFGKLHSYSPAEDDKDKSFIRERRFYLRVADLAKDDEVRKQILTANPDWLNQKEDKERYLKTKVVVRIFIRQRFELLNPKAGVLLKYQASAT